jgi:hypothetical protein
MGGLTEWTQGAVALCAALVLSVIARHRFSERSSDVGLRTPGWTEQHRRVAAAIVVMSTASLVGLSDSPTVAVWVGAAVAITAVLSLATEPFAGFVVGLAAAAAVIATRRVLGPWGPDAFWLSTAQTAALVATAPPADGQGRRCVRGRGSRRLRSSLEPAFGSLGLLEADVAMARLEEEVERAAEHRRPLALILIDTEVVDVSLDAEARRSALRALARIFEGRLREGDVPFAIAADRLGAILPETTSSAAAGAHRSRARRSQQRAVPCEERRPG